MKMKNNTQTTILHLQDQMKLWTSLLTLLLLSWSALAQKPTVRTDAGDVAVHKIADGLDHPWGIEFLPDNRLLVTERAGTLRILEADNTISDPVPGTPEVFNVGQGGLLDVALHPDFDQNKYVYFTYSDPGPDSTATTALGRGTFENDQINNFEVLFKMEPYVKGPNHFGGRINFTEDNEILLTLAERFKFDPAQDLSSHLGTVVRLKDDGTASEKNPKFEDKNARKEIWSYGHRNIESAAIHPQTGELWVAEMGPMGGDELQVAKAGKNYGWPVVSWGDNYDGSEIPKPSTRPEFEDAVVKWTPTISPSGMIFYEGDLFPEWKNSMFIGGLTSSGLVRVKVNGAQAEEVERIPLAKRIRDVEQHPDGSIWVITDEDNGMILQLKPVK
ncbi:Glucose/arabinose dehydrogenase, beta-propeller fold [Salinimicrobium sediminis]|uniref:Glucose/arabinose dehydrogenase, beta-propeller fold n=1 Tax=Salinimicrobium sediminis TaxID=1343891 RepID=A0A285X554_9FLAO|nr:PQQ-dependent sugar dehydrogenase [Salinimicrobium sediminis]SOC80483.1 Glucose/arabinose dehydrogenase, beta-propeller fold [Salinimicrobium sediminis]